MENRDKRVDAYISKAEDFAKPILNHLRELVHKACPEVTETIKWGFPAFEYKGPMCSMASFTQHTVFGFWKAQLLNDPKGFLKRRSAEGGEAMMHMGKVKNLADLPPDKVLLDLIKQAKVLNDKGIKLPKIPKEKIEINIPEYFLKALKRDKETFSNFEKFSPSCKREYVQWITEAKTEPTREKRMNTALEWIGEGKHRNWKYMKK